MGKDQLFQRGELPPFEKGRLGGIFLMVAITPFVYETLH
jgi:hypothetical protein